MLTMIFIVCEHFSENIFSTKFVLRNKHTRFFISDMHISTCRLDFGESNEVSCFRLGLSQCFCLVVQSKFHELCCECILRHKLCRICVKVRGDTMYILLTKREVKMAGYWPSSLFAFLWTETKSRIIKTQKENEANTQPS